MIAELKCLFLSIYIVTTLYQRYKIFSVQPSSNRQADRLKRCCNILKIIFVQQKPLIPRNEQVIGSIPIAGSIFFALILRRLGLRSRNSGRYVRLCARRTTRGRSIRRFREAYCIQLSRPAEDDCCRVLQSDASPFRFFHLFFEKVSFFACFSKESEYCIVREEAGTAGHAGRQAVFARASDGREGDLNSQICFEKRYRKNRINLLQRKNTNPGVELQ